MKINTLLIDDEISALRTLQGMLKGYFPNVNVIGSAVTVNDACELAKTHTPDLVFLDIQMPPFGSGFDFLEKCIDLHFGVIFATAHPDYAVKAINTVQPWAYLIKPYSLADLKNALTIAEEKLKAAQEDEVSPTQSLVIPDARKGNVIVRYLDIKYCKADGSTVEVFFIKYGKLNRIVASRTLKDIEEELSSSLFCRCHHSYVVNLSCIDRFERTGRNGVLHMKDGQIQVPVSIGKMEDFDAKFKSYLKLD